MLGFEALIASATNNIANIAREMLLDPRGNILNNLAILGKTLKARNETSINRAAQAYAHQYFQRYGIKRVLGKAQPIPLKSLYIPIHVWRESNIHQCTSLENLVNTCNQSEVRHWQFIYNDRLPGIQAANQHQYLMVLGEPGTGKSTFLQHIALEVLQGQNFGGIGNYTYIPVFIDLKEVGNFKVDIEKIISDEFTNSKFPFPEKLTKKLLIKGKLLILFDSLNELPENQIKNVILQIKHLINKYPKNRLIVSCRTASYRYNLTKFTNVLVSPFEESQIERFLCNWFYSDSEELNFTALACWELLQKAENYQAKELAKNTLHLSFLCLVYEREKSLPQSLKALYQKVWQILLESGLSDPRLQLNDREKLLIADKFTNFLSEIAFISFETDKPLLEKQFILNSLRKFMSLKSAKNLNLDVDLVVDAIAIESGIFVNQLSNMLVFFHPVLTEYLTAEYIYKHEKIGELVANHLNELRWQTVFLLLAEKMGSEADKLLLQIEMTAQKYIVSPKLQALLSWANQITADSEGNIKPAAKRATAILISRGDFASIQEAGEDIEEADELSLATEEDFAFSQDFMLTMSRDRIFATYLAYFLGLDLGLILARSRILASSITDTIGLARTQIFADETTRELAGTAIKVRGRFLDLDFNFALDCNRDLALDRTRDLALVCILAREYEKLKISQGATQFVAELEALQECVPGNNEPLAVHRKFRDRLQTTWLKTFNINPDLVNLSSTEIAALGNYLYANCLMIQCYQAAGEVNLEIWDAIESRMLQQIPHL
ncbi:hypothetical protein BCD67_06285 [Oscillatoriales cyanobacterium USR001]|nr:hypothetical protein BCD67_06285 [Oscillatoriales cyanobacterium USR001]